MNEDTLAAIGRAPENRREALVKLMWIVIWLAFMGAPVSDLLQDEHTAWATALGGLGLASFVGCYLFVVFRHTSKPLARATVHALLAGLLALATLLSLTLGSEWLVLFVYAAVASGAALPLPMARWAIPVITAAMLLVGLRTDHPAQILPAVVIPALLGGFAMTGVRQMVLTTVALREARATVAQLAANEERLRLARDLHDLLGHSLSLITLKSELAGRMLPGRPEDAALQVADIEKVSRQALVDVREAVNGYRRATLPGELAGARTALTAAGITADVPVDPGLRGLTDEQEAALAWSVREAVTNVVRHSGARRCAVSIVSRQTLDGTVAELTVEDDGAGGDATHGNGLTGLTEGLAQADGTLETTHAAHGGFVLTARVPLAGRPGPVGSFPSAPRRPARTLDARRRWTGGSAT